MRAVVLVLGVALVAGCGGAASLRTTPEPSASAASATAVTATITPSGTVTATAITGTIVPDLGTIPPNPTPAPSLTPSPAPGGLSQAQLKYRLIDQFGRLLFCDPDYYPVARGDEQALAHQRLPDIQKDAPTFSAILSHLGIAPDATYTSEQELAIYRDWKMLNALRLEPVSAGFHFLVLSDGRTVDVSPGHPTADGRRVGDLVAGDAYDGAIVASADRVAYSGGATFDILPAGPTGAYWANGVVLGSTLR